MLPHKVLARASSLNPSRIS